MVSPQTRGKMKNVFGVFFFFSSSTVGRKRDENSSADKHVVISLYVIQALAHSKQSREHTHTHTHTQVICLLLWIRHTHTHTYMYYAAVLTDGPRGGPHLPKCRCWTDCGGVMNGWWRLSRGAEETISAMLISPLLLRPASIPHSPRSLPLILSSVLPVNHCLPLLRPISRTWLLSRSLSLPFAPYRH